MVQNQNQVKVSMKLLKIIKLGDSFDCRMCHHHPTDLIESNIVEIEIELDILQASYALPMLEMVSRLLLTFQELTMQVLPHQN